MAEIATEPELAKPTSPTCASCGARSRSTVGLFTAEAAAPGPVVGQRTLRDLVTDETSRIRHRLARELPEADRLRRRVHAPGAAAARALQRRAPALRALQRRGGNPEGARPPGGPQVRRLPDHRPDRGDDHHRRQHRRLRRRAQLRRHHLQDQPRGQPGDRPPAAPAQPRRHHHHRLHRHGERRASRDGAGGVPQGAVARPHQDDASTASPHSAWWR
jgi:hypothetical protein